MNARSDFDTLAPEFTVQVNGAALPNEAMADLIARRFFGKIVLTP